MKVLVIGGTRYFGKRYVHLLLKNNHQVTVLSRGHVKDDFGDKVERLHSDRTNKDELQRALGNRTFDVVTDQFCMTAQDASDAVEIFKDRTQFYIMTSTLSVYPQEANLREEDFPPGKFTLIENNGYAEGKRAAENVFSDMAPFPVAFARFPIVLGPDDYTMRLHNEVKRIREGHPIYYPNLNASFSFISSDDAARALYWLTMEQHKGAFNFASEESIRIRDLVKMIKEETGKIATLSTRKEDISPFGIENDYFMNVEKAKNLGFTCTPLSAWLRPLIKQFSGREQIRSVASL